MTLQCENHEAKKLFLVAGFFLFLPGDKTRQDQTRPLPLPPSTMQCRAKLVLVAEEHYALPSKAIKKKKKKKDPDYKLDRRIPHRQGTLLGHTLWTSGRPSAGLAPAACVMHVVWPTAA